MSKINTTRAVPSQKHFLSVQTQSLTAPMASKGKARKKRTREKLPTTPARPLLPPPRDEAALGRVRTFRILMTSCGSAAKCSRNPRHSWELGDPALLKSFLESDSDTSSSYSPRHPQPALPSLGLPSPLLSSPLLSAPLLPISSLLSSQLHFALRLLLSPPLPLNFRQFQNLPLHSCQAPSLPSFFFSLSINKSFVPEF